MNHNEDSCCKLAYQVISGWDYSMLEDFAIQVLTERYLANKELFELDAKNEHEIWSVLANPLDSDDEE